jgi:hypothetical protein
MIAVAAAITEAELIYSLNACRLRPLLSSERRPCAGGGNTVRPIRGPRVDRQGRHGLGVSRSRHELKRDVAIKLLLEQFARDEERLARFKREAQRDKGRVHPKTVSHSRRPLDYLVRPPMKRSVMLLVLVMVAPILLVAQTSKSSVEGVWKVVEIVVTGANATTISKPLPSLYIFTKSHYSIVAENGTTARPSTVGAASSDKERLAAYEWFTANAGTYQIKGNTLTTRPLIAKNPDVMAPFAQPALREFQVDGNTLVLTRKSPNGQSEERTKLTRVE